MDGPDAGLAAGVSLEAVLERVLSRHPALHEASARTAAEQARAGAAGRLPAPALEAQLYQAPLDRPAEWGRANMLMLGVRQGLPPPGLREARARAARAVADAGREGVGARRLELAAQARKAFAAYAHAAREEEVHLQHVDLNQQIVSLARGRFEAGRMSKRDLLRTTYELARLHADVAGVEAQSRATRALLNTLMARDPDAPLGPPVASTSSSPSATAALPGPSPLAGREASPTSTPPPEPAPTPTPPPTPRPWRRWTNGSPPARTWWPRPGGSTSGRPCWRASAGRRPGRSSWWAPPTATCRWTASTPTP
ncbi:MAG: TolC family protein [Anaeromyxobacter sp.]|nr:TolC family protein [Anaeromyxobacter sp.]